LGSRGSRPVAAIRAQRVRARIGRMSVCHRRKGCWLAFRRCRGNRDLAGFRLVAHAYGPLLGVVRVVLSIFLALVAIALLIAPALIALRVLLRGRAAWLALLLRLVHGVQNAEIMFRMLEEGLGRHPVSAAGRIAAQLQIFFEKLLGGTANADVRSIAVEDVIAIKRDATARTVAGTATSASTAATTA
jgi:hypothetical protein